MIEVVWTGRAGRLTGAAPLSTMGDTAGMEDAMSAVIVRDPDILGGRPVFRGTRVPVEVLFENLEDGLSLDEIVESYPSLDKRDLIACLEEACAQFTAA